MHLQTGTISWLHSTHPDARFPSRNKCGRIISVHLVYSPAGEWQAGLRMAWALMTHGGGRDSPSTAQMPLEPGCCLPVMSLCQPILGIDCTLPPAHSRAWLTCAGRCAASACSEWTTHRKGTRYRLFPSELACALDTDSGCSSGSAPLWAASLAAACATLGLASAAPSTSLSVSDALAGVARWVPLYRPRFV